MAAERYEFLGTTIGTDIHGAANSRIATVYETGDVIQFSLS